MFKAALLWQRGTGADLKLHTSPNAATIDCKRDTGFPSIDEGRRGIRPQCRRYSLQSRTRRTICLPCGVTRATSRRAGSGCTGRKHDLRSSPRRVLYPKQRMTAKASLTGLEVPLRRKAVSDWASSNGGANLLIIRHSIKPTTFLPHSTLTAVNWLHASAAPPGAAVHRVPLSQTIDQSLAMLGVTPSNGRSFQRVRSAEWGSLTIREVSPSSIVARVLSSYLDQARPVG